MKKEFPARPGHRATHLLAIFAVAGAAQGMLVAPAYTQVDSWSPLAPMPTPRRLLAAAAEGGAIYTFGGCGSPCFDPPVHTSTFEETRLEVYEGGSWSVREPIPAILFGAAAAAPGNGRIYVFGGFVTGHDAYEYDPGSHAWSRKAAMPTPRHGLAAVALKGKVYVLGGSNGDAATGALEIYDPALNSWTPAAPMPTPRVFFAAAALNGRIYAIGGSPECRGKGRTDAVEVYDPETGRWSRAASLPLALQVSAAAAVNGRIYIFGGFIPGSGVQGSTFEYDPEENVWRSRTPMPEPRDQAPAVVLREIAEGVSRDIVHVAGGSVDCHCRARDTHEGYTPSTSAPTADLKIEKAVDPAGPVSPGETIHYTITVTNQGPAAVNGATVTDDLTATGLRSVRWCRGRGCTPSKPGNLLEVLPLAAGESVIYEATGAVAPNAQGTLSNTAAVRPPASPGDPNPGNNVSTVTNPIVPCSVSITKTDGRSQAAPGDELRYRITVRNGCPTAVQATVTDDLAATGLIGAQWCRGADCTSSSPVANTVTLPANGTVAFDITGTVPCACGRTEMVNTACVSVPGRPARCATDTDRIQPSPGGQLALDITGPSQPGDCGALPQTFTVTNPGPGIACGVTLQVQLPEGSELVSISNPCSGLLCGLGDIAPGSTVQVTATFRPPGGLQCPATLSTTASVSGCTSNVDAFETKLPCALAVTKSDGLEKAAPGDPILYKIEVENRGCAAVSGAVVQDAFPTELQNVHWCRGIGCEPFLAAPLLNPLDLLPGAKETYLAEGSISLEFAGSLSNTVTVSPTAGPPVVATDDTLITPEPGIKAFCAGIAGSFFEGETITYTFVIWNGGPADKGDDPGPEFTDTLPAGLTLVDATADSGTITTAANTADWNGAIPAGSKVVIQIRAMIDAGTAGLTICNQAMIPPDEASPCCFTVLPTPVIPALSLPGALALILLLFLLARARLRRTG